MKKSNLADMALLSTLMAGYDALKPRSTHEFSNFYLDIQERKRLKKAEKKRKKMEKLKSKE